MKKRCPKNNKKTDVKNTGFSQFLAPKIMKHKVKNKVNINAITYANKERKNMKNQGRSKREKP